MPSVAARGGRLACLAATALFCTAACRLECGGLYRNAAVRGTVSDAADSVHVDVVAALTEEGAVSRQLVVTVMSVSAPNPQPAPPALVGRVKRVRLELADATVLYDAPLIPAASDEPSLVGLAVNDDLSPSAFAAIRAHLLANETYVVLETEPGAPVMQRTPLRVEQSADWRRHGCA